MSGCDDLTAADREWIAGELARDPRLTEAMLVDHLCARYALARLAAKERAEAERLGVTVRALRQAREERRVHEREAQHRRDVDAARLAIGEDLPPGVSQERLDRYARAALALREPDGTWPTQAVVAESLGQNARALRQVGWDRILHRAGQLARGGTTA